MTVDERMRVEMMQALTAWIRAEKLNQDGAGRILGVSQPLVSRIIRTDLRPHRVSLTLLLRLWERIGGGAALTLMSPGIQVNHIKQHIPKFVSGFVPEEAYFRTLDELQHVTFVARAMKHPHFLRLSKSEDRLMLELSTPPIGEFWVLGFLKDPARVDLPEWVETPQQRDDREAWNRGERRE